MAKDINLTSKAWCDLIFEGRNKTYGAYAMRQSSSKRHLMALLIVGVLAAFLTILPTLISTIENATRRQTSDSLQEESVLAELKELEDKVNEQDIIVYPGAGILYYDAIGMLCAFASCPALYLVFKIIHLY